MTENSIKPATTYTKATSAALASNISTAISTTTTEAHFDVDNNKDILSQHHERSYIFAPILPEPTTSTTTADPNPSPQPFTRSPLRRSLILSALFLSLFVSALDATIVATAVPVISHTLDSATGYVWIAAAYLIANAAGAPILGKLSDIWGRKIVFLCMIALFFASSAICGSAGSMRTLIAARSIQGIAGGGLILLVHVVISDLYSVRERSLFMGLTEFIWALAGGIGPLLGGLFASKVSWRWCFYVNLPICAAAFVLIFVFLDVKHEKTGMRTGLKAIDWWGMVTFLACTLMILLGLNFGGAVFAWDSARVICLIVIGAVMVGAFVYSEARLARYPIIPLGLFKNRSNLAALGVGVFHGLAFIPAEYYLPLWYQSVKQVSPLRSGILFVPFIVSTALAGVCGGVIIHRSGRYRELMWIGTCLLTLGLGLLTILDAKSSTGEAIGLTLVLGVGSGLLFEPPLIAIQAHSKQDDVATATSTFSFGRCIALAVSIVIGGVVFNNSMDAEAQKLLRQGIPSSITDKLRGSQAAANVALASQLENPTQRLAVQQAFATSMRNMWIMYACLGGVAFICSLFVGSVELSHEHTETATGIRNEKQGEDTRIIEMA